MAGWTGLGAGRRSGALDTRVEPRSGGVAARGPSRVREEPRGHEKAPVVKTGAKMAGWTGLEPATFCVTGRRSNQLSYHPGMGKECGP